MLKLVYILGALLVLYITGSSCQHIIRPTYRPPPRRPVIIRAVREAGDEPLWLYKGDNIDRAPSTADHPVLPSIIDDIKLDPIRRFARSLDSPSAKRGGGSHTTSSSSRNTGATHPGYNRRNTREIRLPEPFRIPSPTIPKPINPILPRPWSPRQPYPIYARTTRDIQIPGIKKPSYRDIVIPNWNPNIRTQPWQRLGGKKYRRSIESDGNIDNFEYDAVENL
ncbi:lebocin [Aphomia sociella]